jgi:predicted nucleic acid-binding protein
VKLIDTTIAVDHLRGVDAAVELMTTLIEEDETLAASELVRFELLAGVLPNEIDAFEQFCSSILWLPVDEEVTRAGGSLARKYRKSHSGIDDVDYLIAAAVITFDADLLTTNVRHFPMFPDLEPPY